MRLLADEDAVGIIPAYAGSTDLGLLDGRSHRGSSPHTRGARHHEVQFHGNPQDHPRIRGEHYKPSRQGFSPPGSSPHTRGALGCAHATPLPRWIIPAYAGSTSCCRVIGAPGADHPRIRGEHLIVGDEDTDAVGSSPHTRGALDVPERVPVPHRIIPAYAGSTRPRSVVTDVAWDHPRIRGEHHESLDHGLPGTGSSPHTRGARERLPSETPERRIIPAYAGSTHAALGGDGRRGDHPRIRGEHCHFLPFDSGGAGSSPHTRGARQTRNRRPYRDGIIPAYAGSTRLDPDRSGVGEDHPRIRGEHQSLV